MILTKQVQIVRPKPTSVPILLDDQISLLTHSLRPNTFLLTVHHEEFVILITKITGIEENDPYVYSRLHIVYIQ
jgi:hypothetical protein